MLLKVVLFAVRMMMLGAITWHQMVPERVAARGKPRGPRRTHLD